MSCIGMMSLLPSRDRERHQRDHPRAPHGQRQRALVLGAVAADPTWHELAAIGDEALEQGRVLVVDRGRVLAAEAAHLAAGEAAASAASALAVVVAALVAHIVVAIDHGSGSVLV